MNWMNNFYLKRQPLDLITDMCIPHLQKAGFIEEPLSAEKRESVRSIVALYQEQMSYCAQIVPLAALFFLEEVVYDEEAEAVLKEPQLPEVLESFRKHLLAHDEYNVDTIKAVLKDVQKETGHKGKALFMPIRVAATGQAHGRDLAETLYLLGRDKVLERVSNVLSNGK
jgi:nondiscriminating glutamyl-tRNA synthetase